MTSERIKKGIKEGKYSKKFGKDEEKKLPPDYYNPAGAPMAHQ